VRRYVLIIIAMSLALLVAVQPAAALPVLQVPYLRAGPVWALSPFMQADFVFIQTNASHLFAAEDEALAISLGTAGFSSPSGPSPGSALAFSGPIIAQTSSRALFCDRSFFVIDEIA